MHICFLEDTHLHGGTQIWVSEAIRVCLAAGHEVTVLTVEDGYNHRDAVQTEARVVTYGWDDVVRQDAEQQRIWTEALVPADVTVCTVHPPRDGFHCSMFAAKCIAEGGLNTVLQPKTGTIMPDYIRDYYVPREDIRCHVICITDFTRRYLIDTYGIPEDRVSLIYQGTELSIFSPDPARAAEAKRRYPVPVDSGPILGNVGSFEHRKGQVILLEALSKALPELPDVHLLLVGDGPDEEMLREQVTHFGLDGHVSFFPFTREPAHVFEVIDALVLSSTYKEGLPNVILEALAMGVPAISTRIAGTPEVVHEGETGLLVPIGDIDALTTAIVELGSDPVARERMGEAGRRLMHDGFDKQLQFGAFLDHFDEITEALR